MSVCVHVFVTKVEMLNSLWLKRCGFVEQISSDSLSLSLPRFLTSPDTHTHMHSHNSEHLEVTPHGSLPSVSQNHTLVHSQTLRVGLDNSIEKGHP